MLEEEEKKEEKEEKEEVRELFTPPRFLTTCAHCRCRGGVTAGEVERSRQVQSEGQKGSDKVRRSGGSRCVQVRWSGEVGSAVDVW